MKQFIDLCLRYRFIVLALSALIFILGFWSLGKIKLDAIPDLSDTQVIIEVRFEGQPPQVVEDQVTYPLTTRMLSVPKSKTVRGYSYFDYALIYVLFEDGTDIYWARSRVLEYLNSMQGKLPAGVTTSLGPDATSIGWVYEYAIRDKSGKHTLADLRDIQDFMLRYELTALHGVSEVASLGGFQRQFQIEVNPDRLYQYGVKLSDIEMALKKSNMESGSRLLELAESEYMVLVRGYITGSGDILKIPIRATAEGGVLRIGDIARVTEGPEMRRGLADLNGEGEAVGGIVIMRQGEDALETTDRVKVRLDELRKSLPEGIEIVTTYDRSVIIREAVGNLKWKLVEEMAVVSLLTIIFLLHLRSSLVALVIFPIGIFGSFLLMYIFKVPANIMSLGGIAIAIGEMVDSAVVMVENTHKHLERLRKTKSSLSADDYMRASKEAVLEVAPGLFWSMIIITVSFLPVFALTDQSGKMFKPLAFTKTLAMGMAAILTIVLMPILVAYFVRGKIPDEAKNPISRGMIRVYMPLLVWSLNNKKRVSIGFGLLLIMSIIPLTGIKNPFSSKMLINSIGSEFMPPLEEGDLLYMPTTLPGISISKAREILITTDALIRKVPEVKLAFGKAGRAETATDPAPLMMIETNIILKEKKEWRKGMTVEKIIEELDKTVRLPGVVNAWTMPIKTRIDMLSTGIKTPIGIKIMGDDLQILQHIAQTLEGEIKQLGEVSSVFGERTMGGKYITYNINRDRAAMYGLTVADINDVLSTALGGRVVTDIIKGQYRWTANIRYARSSRESLEDLQKIYIPLPEGRGQIPVSQVADIRIETGPDTIKTENGRKTSWLFIDTRTNDITALVKQIRNKIDTMIVNKEVHWPAGYSYIISGQYEQIEIAASRMKILVPVVLFIVFMILYLEFRNFQNPAFIMLASMLFAPLGGLWFMFLAGYNRSVATDVGFIAMIGLAAETGVIMLVYLDSALENIKWGKGKMSIKSSKLLREAILDGAVMRVRPKMMTVFTTIFGLVPLFWGDEPGNVAMRRIAAPLTGGLVTSTFVTLILLPMIYEWWHSRRQFK